MSIQEDFRNNIIENNLICSRDELNNYLAYGILFKRDGKYYDRSFNLINIKHPQRV